MIDCSNSFGPLALLNTLPYAPPFLLNGGALVVYLALLGGVTDKEGFPLLDRGWATWAMWLWIGGLVIGSTATALGYFSQDAFRRHRDHEIQEQEAREEGNSKQVDERKADAKRLGDRGQWTRLVAGIAIIVSVCLFIGGVLTAVQSLPVSP